MLKPLSLLHDRVNLLRRFGLVLLLGGVFAPFQFGQALVAVGLDRHDLLVDLVAPAPLFARDLVFQALQRLLARVFVHMRYDVLGKIKHAVEIAPRHIQQQAQVRRHAAGVPHMRHRRRQFNMSHALAAHR
jgi:hypothetical protein